MQSGKEGWAAKLGPVNAGRDAWGEQLPSACVSLLGPWLWSFV